MWRKNSLYLVLDENRMLVEQRRTWKWSWGLRLFVNKQLRADQSTNRLLDLHYLLVLSLSLAATSVFIAAQTFPSPGKRRRRIFLLGVGSVQRLCRSQRERPWWADIPPLSVKPCDLLGLMKKKSMDFQGPLTCTEQCSKRLPFFVFLIPGDMVSRPRGRWLYL